MPRDVQEGKKYNLTAIAAFMGIVCALIPVVLVLSLVWQKSVRDWAVTEREQPEVALSRNSLIVENLELKRILVVCLDVLARLESENGDKEEVDMANDTRAEKIRKLTCNRCGWSWWPRSASPPGVCPACNSPYWDKPRRYDVPPNRRAKQRAR